MANGALLWGFGSLETKGRRNTKQLSPSICTLTGSNPQANTMNSHELKPIKVFKGHGFQKTKTSSSAFRCLILLGELSFE